MKKFIVRKEAISMLLNLKERKLNRSKGFILLTSYMLLAMISIFSLGLFTRGSIFLQSADRNKKKMVAFNMAEAGFDDAFYRIKNNTIAAPWSSGYVSLDTGNIQGGYSVTVSSINGSSIKQISVTGYSPTQAASTQTQELRTINGYVQPAPSNAFNFGVFAKNSITLNGNANINSYDSSAGAYGGANIKSNGDIATDSTGAGTVSLTGNSTINGNATVGPGGNPATVITLGANTTITGSETAASSAQNPPSATTSTTSEGTLSISGNTNYQLSAGVHHFTSLSITGNGKITPLGAVTVYVDGTVNIAGNGVATVSNLPTNFILYSTGTSSVSLSGNGNFYGAIYSPDSAVSNTGNGQLFGAVVSKTYQQSGNGNVHFDEALKQVANTSGTGLTLLSWQETNKTAG